MHAERRLLLLAGEQAWSEAWVMGQLGAAELAATLWVAQDAPAVVAAVAADRVTRHLGSEYRLLVFNAHQGFHPDAFAAAVGTLRGGGDCVVFAPSLDAWPAFADPDQHRFTAYPHTAQDMHGLFLERLVRLWQAHAACHLVTPSSELRLRIAPAPADAFRLTPQQEQAVAAVERVAHGHARRPLVLTADRGRGKSTVLGVAAARLLTDGLTRVTVVAPHRAAVATLFRHALGGEDETPHEVVDSRVGRGMLRFRLPSECMTAGASEAPGLLMVDEAAAIPVAVLSHLLKQHNRLVFTSTVHGYEGSGRGFDIRFRSLLQRQMPQWRGTRLQEPVRWAVDDPLEDLLDRSFLLDADLADVDQADIGGGLVIDAMEVADLADDEALLRSVFGLLVNAHYQTRPSDLRQLLDNPDLRLWLARHDGTPVGVLLGLAEGGFDDAMAAQIVRGKRRPRGHLLPQSLAIHAGLEQILQKRVMRVQRIAVHPDLQCQGVGRRLLQALADWASAHEFDALGCAYGIEPRLLDFWQAAGFRPVRLSIRVDPASAAHSLFMLHGLSAPGRTLTNLGHARFQADLPWSLAAGLSDLDSQLAVRLLLGRDCVDLALSDAECADLSRLATGARQPATAAALVWKAVVLLAARGSPSADKLAPLITWQLQRRSVKQVCAIFALPGRRALEDHMRAMLVDLQMPRRPPVDASRHPT